MAISAAAQTLVAAFFFGILLQAASGALLIHFKGHGRPVSQDSRRLVLMVFLFLAALWALIDFINLNIRTSTTSCQVALVFSTLSDQLARVGIEQFLLWSIGDGTKVTMAQLVMQSILGVRFIVGIVLVGFTRPDFTPVCVARTSLLPIAILVLVLDVIIIATLAVVSLWIEVPKRGQSKELILIVIGFALWTGTSAAMLLGIYKVVLVVKTTLPSIGLLILVGIVAIFADSLSPREMAIIPEATSPFVTRSLSSGGAIPENFENGSIISGRRYTASGNPLVVNPPTMPRALPTTTTTQVAYPDNSEAFTSSGMVGRSKASVSNDQDYNMRAIGSGNQIPYGNYSSAFAGPSAGTSQGSTVVQLGMGDNMERNLSFPSHTIQIQRPQRKRSLFKWSKPASTSTIRNTGISKPVIVNSDGSSQPFARIRTIDLATAAANERERREDAASRARLVPKRPAPPPPHAIDAALRKSVSVKRKEAPSRRNESLAELPASTVSEIMVAIANASATSASLSPGRENIRQRSPSTIKGFRSLTDEKGSKHILQRKPTAGLPPTPRSQRTAKTSETVMRKRAAEKHSSQSNFKFAEETPESSYATALKKSGSILHRPRPYRRDTEKDRALFPSGAYPYHRRSKSGSSIIASRKSIFESHPGSPTQLPHLPTPPTRASDLAHILSNHNKSMTFHEKIRFLFPAPPMSSLRNQRRSSVPSLPSLPSVYMSDASPVQSPANEGQQSSRASKMSRTASFETEDIWGSTALPADADTLNSQQEHFVGSYRTYSDRVFMSSLKVSSSQSDLTTAVDPLFTRRNATADRPPRDARWPKQLEDTAWSTSNGTSQSFFLDANQYLPGDKTPSPNNSSAWHRRIGDELPTFSERTKNSKSRKMPPPTPLLLSRNGNSVSVVVHSPAPSPVDSPGNAMKKLQAQLKHFEEPNHESLGPFLRRMSAGNPSAVSDVKDDCNSRSRLLQDLEKEMGQQESLWQKMQNNFDCDSNSVILTPQMPTPLLEDSSQESSQRSAARNAQARKSMIRNAASSSSTSSHSSNNSRTRVWQQRLAEAQMEYVENASILNHNRNLNLLWISQSQLGSPTPPESVDSETDIETGSESETVFSRSEVESDIIQRRKSWLWQPQPPVSEARFSGLWDPTVTSSKGVGSLDAPAKDIRPLKRLIREALPIFSSVLWSKLRSSSTGTYIGLWGSRKVRPTSIIVRRASQRPQRKSRRIGYLPDIVESPLPLPHKRDTLGIFQFPSGETSDSAVYHSAFSPTVRASSVLNNVPREVKAGKPGPDPTGYPSSFFDDYDEQDDSGDLESGDDFDETLWEISSLLVSKDAFLEEDYLPIAIETREILNTYDNDAHFAMDTGELDIIPSISTEFRGAVHDALLPLPVRPLVLSSKDHSKLWTSPSLPTLNAHAKGLLQPDSRIWDSYVSKSQSDLRSRPHPPWTLPVLTTSTLWTPSPVEKPTQTVASLWKPTKTPKELPITATKTPVTPSTLLWTPHENKFTQHKPNHALATTQASKPFSKVFAAEAGKQFSHDLSMVRTPMLWTPVVEAEAKLATTPLSMLDGDTCNSFMAPVTIVRRAQVNEAPLDRLESSQLWSGCQFLEAGHHWISVSSVRPESPSMQSESSSGGSSPTSDTLSVKSSGTKSSSIWGSIKSVGASLSWNTKLSKNSMSTTPTDTKTSSATPASPPAPTSLPSVRESRVLAFRDLFEPRASESEDSLTHKQPRSNRTSLVHPGPDTSDNNFALTEAASNDEPYIQNRRCTSQTQEAFLSEPDACSPTETLSPNLVYDVAICHPVFFISNLVSSCTDIHPAAIGYIKSPAITQNGPHELAGHDSGELYTRARETTMWTALPVKVKSASNFGLLWLKDSELQMPDKFEILHNKPARSSPSVPKSLNLSALESSTLLRPTIAVKSKRDWLPATNSSRVQMWNPPDKIGHVKNKALMTVAPHSSQDIFAHIKEERAGGSTPSRQLPLPAIDSSQLFESRTLAPDSPIHWLHSTSNMTEALSHSLTWTAPAPLSAEIFDDESGGLWTPRADAAALLPALFSNPHTAPWVKKKMDPVSTEITSSELWRLSTVLPANPKHWLVDRRASRVQFRY